MAKFKIVKHSLSYHVIGFTGTKKPRTKGAKPTYKEQCISSHWTLKRAEKALDKYKATQLDLSSKVEASLMRKIIKETPLAVALAIAGAVIVEILILLKGHI